MATMSVTPPANAAEHARLQSHLRAVLRLKAGCDHQNSVTALTVRAYASIVDEVVADVAGELHRAIATGLDTIDSVSQRVPPADDVIAGYHDAVAAQEAEAERLCAGGFFGEANVGAGAVKQDVAGGDLYGRGPGAAKDTAECPVCAQRVAASRFAHHLERCLGKGRLAVRRPASLAAPQKDPPAPRKTPASQSAVGRPPRPIEHTRSDRTPPAVADVPTSTPVPPRVRFVLNPRATDAAPPARRTQKTRITQKTKSVASLMGLKETDDAPLSAIVHEARSSKTKGKEKGDFGATSKAREKEKARQSATGVAAGKVAKDTAASRVANAGAAAKGKKTVAGRTTAARSAVAKKQRRDGMVSEDGAFRVSVDAPFGGGETRLNAVGETRGGGLGGFGAPAGDSFAFEHERGAGDGSGSTHEDFELLFDVDHSGGATGGGEGVLTGGFRDLFAS